MNVVDASVVIAYLDDLDVHHAEAIRVIAEAGAGLMMHPITIAEVLARPARVGRAADVWTELAAIACQQTSTRSTSCSWPNCEQRPV